MQIDSKREFTAVEGLRAVENFQGGRNCAQAVLMRFRHDLEEDQALRVACAYGGGICGKQRICGALSGALMAIGLAGFQPENQDTCKEIVYARSKKLMQEFEKEFGSIECTDLLGVDTSTDEGKRIKEEQQLSHKVCDKLIEWVEENLPQYL